MADCLRFKKSGEAEWLNEQGELVVELLHLNADDNIRFRKMIFDTLNGLRPELEDEILSQWLGFPPELPNLSTRNVENTRPDGIRQSYYPLLGIPAFLVPNEHDRAAINAADSANDCRVIRIHAVAMQFLKIRSDQCKIIGRIRPHRMTRHLGNLPRAELRENAASKRLALAFEARYFVIDIDLGIIANEA
jgi:hypothetical protein